MNNIFLAVRSLSAIAVVATVLACAPSSLVDVQSPNTVVDPSQITTPIAATELYNSAVSWFNRPLFGDGITGSVIGASGLFTDELQESKFTGSMGWDERTISLPANVGLSMHLYTTLHQARVQIQQARQALQLYAPNAPKAWQGQLFALEGYTVLYFAELFCSGIPLSNVPLVGVPQLTRGFTTQELFNKAITLFDSAIVVGSDSAQFVNLAKVGKGRALLGLGQFSTAAASVQDVPIDFVYLAQPNSAYQNYVGQVNVYRAQDAEGGNGLVWSSDPRAAIITLPTISGAMLRPTKYSLTSSGNPDPTIAEPYSPVRMADGLEARLILAEAALAEHDASWLTILDSLRANCIGATPCAPVPGLTSTSLPALADPGTDTARLTLLMKERAMWLYMTGHREGDLRRLARIYQRDPTKLWPTGQVSAPAFPPLYSTPLASNGTYYGTDFVFIPGTQEQTNNPLYSGCSDLNP